MTQSVLPRWTARLYRPTGGQDHLGVASVATDRILPRLSPGVNVLTYHPRYWSFYTWLLWEFWRDDERVRDRRSFARFYRPREAIFAAGVSSLCPNPEHDTVRGGVVGARRASAYVNNHPQAVNSAYHYIDSLLGGYGLYYGTTIAFTGLILPATPDAGLKWDIPEGMGQGGPGEKVAEGFRDAVADTRYYREYFADDDAVVPVDVVEEYAAAACLCQLRTPGAPDRPLLRDVFLHAGVEDNATNRRTTLRMVLDLADQMENHALSQDRYRRLIYFRADGEGGVWTPRDNVADIARQWRLYQSREYYNYALTRLFTAITRWGLGVSGGGLRSVATGDLLAHVESRLDSALLAGHLSLPDPGYGASTPLGIFTTWVGEQAGAERSLDDAWDINAPLHEHRLYQWASELADDSDGAWLAAITILCLLVVRLGSPATELRYGDDWWIVREGGIARLSMRRFFHHYRQRRNDGATLGEAAKWLVTDYVIRQHARVAVSKLPADTFRFQRDGDRLRFNEQRLIANMTNSRFEALATTVHELGLVGYLYADSHPLTDAGRSLLEDGDLPERPVTGTPTQRPGPAGDEAL